MVVEPIPYRVVEHFAIGTHLVALDFDAVLSGRVPDDFYAEAAEPVLELVRTLARLRRCTLVIVSDRAAADLAPRCAGIERLFMIAEGGRVLIDDHRRIDARPATLAERLRGIGERVGASSILYLGPLAYALNGEPRLAAIPVGIGSALAHRVIALRAIAEVLSR